MMVSLAAMIAFLYVMGLAVGLALLIRSADWFTDAAVAIARQWHVPELVVGVTIVSLATTLPEFAVSFLAALEGNVDITVGNAVGSGICNVGLIVGITALLAPIMVNKHHLFAMARTLLFTVLVFAGLEILWPEGNRWTGVILLAGLGFHLAQTFRGAARHPEEIDAPPAGTIAGRTIAILFASGAVGVVIGSMIAVTCAVGLAELAGISQLVISLTVVALGTSCRS